ncbi:signal transduction histidine kinase [Nocardioides thalensis]|uniref:Signal transduction histidine kinase n=1 Tax=Nocardioides thalensis TaxID=1914755 RepID=A0A853C133_9ACTN|nr:sensor histidine kinase [Nocardioides thalensis]NYJ01940.1 signal transduction histidine kinase [Nocardioides thalensis]
MPNSQIYAVVGFARLFALVAIGAPSLWYRESGTLIGLAVVGGIWVYQSATAIRRELELSLSPATEAAAIGIVCGVGIREPALLAALVVPPLYATAVQGYRLMVRAVVIEFIAVVSLAVMWHQVLSGEEGVSIFIWVMAGVGLSLIAGVTFSGDRIGDPLEPYREAQHLLKQLLDLSGSLSSGLDVSALGGAMLSEISDQVPNRGLVLYVPRGDTLTPVASTVELSAGDAAACATLAGDARAREQALQVGQGFAFLASDQAIIAGLLPADGTTVPDLQGLTKRVTADAVKLDAALLFTQFRDTATADERQRLAREMHDGVAQDIASLGYLIDAIAARPADDKQAKALSMLRDRVSKIVAEVRRSVMNLRTSIGENESLGAAISAIARHQSEASGIPIRVRLDEQPQRLRPEVEAELFRITQEALNNAVKHSRATSIDVRCQVYPPEARITVSDDGVGLQHARDDSHGLKIMSERARMIGADLVVRDNASRGLTVSVALRSPRVQGGPAPSAAPKIEESR